MSSPIERKRAEICCDLSWLMLAEDDVEYYAVRS
jgi:hypothetical protein